MRNSQPVLRCLSTTATTLSLAISLVAGSNIAHAKQCDELYQDAIGDEYFDLDKPLIDNQTYQGLNDLADQLDGRWEGTALEVNCGVSDGTPLATIESYDIDAEIVQHHRGSIIVRAEKESDRKVQLENLFISPEVEREMEKLRQGYTDHHPSYTIEFTSPNTMVFDHKYRATNVRPRTSPVFFPADLITRRLVHEIKTVSLDDNQLSILRDVYVNGHFVSQQEWQLKKRY